MGTAHSDNLPFGMQVNHLNLVLSASDVAKIHEFYGEILGLERMPDIPFPDGISMVRYLGGETERYEYGMAYDHDGNQVEPVFIADGAPESALKYLEIGLTVGDTDAMNSFLRSVTGYEELKPAPIGGGVVGQLR
jgi:catechol 2,3-dioxygenase-like lactoylglutathione lyase family enzyme